MFTGKPGRGTGASNAPLKTTGLTMADPLYAKLNSRGKKQFKAPSNRQSFAQHFAEYANLGLPGHKAALDGNVECLKECFCCYMKEGVPSRDVNGATPLHLAAKNNRADTVKWLIRFTDLTPYVTAKHGETPAHVAAAQGHVESLKHMLSADGKEDIKTKLSTIVDNSGFSVLHLAIVKRRNECAKLLINELGPKAVSSLNESGVTAAHIAASAGNVEVLQYLHTKYKKLLQQEDSEGAPPMYYAAQEGRLEVLKFMSEKCKFDLNKGCNDGLKPIHAASQCGHTNIVKYIVSQSGNQAIFETTSDGATPLHFATAANQLHIAQWLINSDASGMLVSKQDKNGDTPAHDASENGNLPMLKLLLENGADIYATNSDDNTPYSFALSGGNMDVANYVMSFASKSPQRDSAGPMKIYSMQGEVDVVEMKNSEMLGQTEDQEEPPSSFQQEELQRLSPLSASPFKTSEQPQPAKKGKASGKKEKKDKKSKKEEKGQKKSMVQTLKSFDTNTTISESKGDKDVALEMTENELAMFNDTKPLVPSSSEDENIIVRYSAPGTINPLMVVEPPAEPGYSTINELEMMKQKKEKKAGRKEAKSIQKAMKKKQGGKKTQQQPVQEMEMGFKPQFRTNPLLKSGNIPPTPPPTPATAASIATSDDTPQHNLEDVEEIDDEEFVPGDDGFAPYAVPDPEVVKMKAKRRELEEQDMLKSSENQKLLKDALEDLSGDESPPQIPKQRFPIEDAKDQPSQISAQLDDTKTTRQEGSKTSLESNKAIKTSKPADEEVKNKFPVLKSSRRENAPLEKPKTELSQIKLKKAGNWKRAEYSSPENETVSGASDELRKILQRKAANTD